MQKNKETELQLASVMMSFQNGSIICMGQLYLISKEYTQSLLENVSC